MKKVMKKDGTLEDFDAQKILNAVHKSSARVMITLTEEDEKELIQCVENLIYDKEDISIEMMHYVVENALEQINPRVAKSYRDYRNYKTEFVHILDDIYQKSQTIMYIGDKENSNTDSALVSTKRSLIFNQLNKELYQKFFLTKDELTACREGYIYVHDMSARRDTLNCCLSDVANILSGGFEMGNIWYNEPKTLDTAFDVIGDIVLGSASQQYGGYTLPEIDKTLAPYAQKSYDKYYDEYVTETAHLYASEDECFDYAENYAYGRVCEEMKQGYQGWEMKFNTVASSRGDYPKFWGVI